MMLATQRLHVDPAAPHTGDLGLAAAILRRGGTVAFATETVYGLGANALDPAAVARIFVAKQRPAWDPLIVHIADDAMLAEVAMEIPASARALMQRFWPGPLTLLLPRTPCVPDAVTAGRSLVGVRMPAHPVALALIRAAGVPVAAPSANTFGHVSPTTAEHVAADLAGRIDAILDSGETLHGLESTVIDTSVDPCIVYRPGAVTLEQLRTVWPAIEPHSDRQKPGDAQPEALPSPGVGLRHYAPRARLVLIQGLVQDSVEGLAQGPVPGQGSSLAVAVESAMAEARHAGEVVGLMQPVDMGIKTEPGDQVYAWGEWADLPMLAHRLFAGLRALDDQGVAIIVCPMPAASGLGEAIGDRLRKAARSAG